MRRRLFIAIALMFGGFGRRTWASRALSSRAQSPPFARLNQPVTIPLTQVETPWQPVDFKAEATGPAEGGGQGRRVLISGTLFRRAPAAGAAAGSAEDLSALCLTCPHEQCVVDLVTKPEQLAKIAGNPAHEPLFECGCHLSVFDARRDGERISGEAPRGLYRFRITAVREGNVEIGEIEEEALSAV